MQLLQKQDMLKMVLKMNARPSMLAAFMLKDGGCISNLNRVIERGSAVSRRGKKDERETRYRKRE